MLRRLAGPRRFLFTATARCSHNAIGQSLMITAARQPIGYAPGQLLSPGHLTEVALCGKSTPPPAHKFSSSLSRCQAFRSFPQAAPGRR
ncbi:MAG: hypothetical protein KDA96_21440, partial [Planctomycetaceae bacterium]|nr:hypothetical protein [Planctomycetaceae bacterium]